MIIFTAGFPFSGKSTLLRKLAEHIKFTVISPKDYRTEEYDKLDENEKRDMNLAAWECSLDNLADEIKNNKDETIIVYDTACASLNRMQEYFELAKKHKHYIIYMFVSTELDICKARAGNSWLDNSIIDKYKVNFRESVPQLAKLADKALTINNNDKVDISKLMGVINVHRVSQPQ